MIKLFELDERFYVALSSLHGAGMGLFARKDVPRDSYLVYWGYRGSPLQKNNVYTYVTRTGVNVDAKDFLDCPARYLNDGGPSGVENNCVWEENLHPLFPCIRVVRHLEQGTELLVSYGPDYWEEQE